MVITYDFSTVHRSSAVVSRHFSRYCYWREGSRVSSNAIYRRGKEAAENVYSRRVFLFSFFFVFFRPTFPCVRSRWTSPSVLLHTSTLSVSLSLCVFFFFLPENRILRSRTKAAKLEQQEQEEVVVRARLPSMWGRGTMVKVKRL